MYGSTLSEEELDYWSDPEVQRRFQTLRDQVGREEAYRIVQGEFESDPYGEALREMDYRRSLEQGLRDDPGRDRPMMDPRVADSFESQNRLDERDPLGLMGYLLHEKPMEDFTLFQDTSPGRDLRGIYNARDIGTNPWGVPPHGIGVNTEYWDPENSHRLDREAWGSGSLNDVLAHENRHRGHEGLTRRAEDIRGERTGDRIIPPNEYRGNDFGSGELAEGYDYNEIPYWFKIDSPGHAAIYNISGDQADLRGEDPEFVEEFYRRGDSESRSWADENPRFYEEESWVPPPEYYDEFRSDDRLRQWMLEEAARDWLKGYSRD